MPFVFHTVPKVSFNTIRQTPKVDDTQIKRYGGQLGYRDSRIGEKSW